MQITTALIRLRRCAGWSAPVLFANHPRQVFSRRGHMIYDCDTSWSYTIRIYHEFEGRIEKSIPRIAVWHHKACPVMTNGDPEGWIFLSYPHTNNGFFFFLTTIFIVLIFYSFIYFKISFQKSLNKLRCNFT